MCKVRFCSMLLAKAEYWACASRCVIFFAFIGCPNRKAGCAEFTNASFHCTIILRMTVVAA